MSNPFTIEEMEALLSSMMYLSVKDAAAIGSVSDVNLNSLYNKLNSICEEERRKSRIEKCPMGATSRLSNEYYKRAKQRTRS